MHGAHATHNSTCERPLVAQGSVARPSPGKGESASKAMSRLVGTHLREVSYYPSKDDYEHMAALRMKCKNVEEAYARPGGSAEVNSLARQVGTLPDLPSPECLPDSCHPWPLHPDTAQTCDSAPAHPLPSCPLCMVLPSWQKCPQHGTCTRMKGTSIGMKGASERAGPGARPEDLQGACNCGVQEGNLQRVPRGLQVRREGHHCGAGKELQRCADAHPGAISDCQRWSHASEPFYSCSAMPWSGAMHSMVAMASSSAAEGTALRMEGPCQRA